jgi:hypothetical protein
MLHLFASSKLQKAFVFSHILEQKNWVVGKIGEQLDWKRRRAVKDFR